MRLHKNEQEMYHNDNIFMQKSNARNQLYLHSPMCIQYQKGTNQTNITLKKSINKRKQEKLKDETHNINNIWNQMQYSSINLCLVDL